MEILLLFYFLKVNELLNKSPVWSAYKDQKHDLFITDNPIAGYLTSGVGGVAGYITAGTGIGASGIPSAPPPLKEPPDDIEGED